MQTKYQYTKFLKFISFGTFIGICTVMLFNFIIDPFGVFGDKFIQWDSYNMVNNPRVAKIAYLNKHHDKYNSYIIGGSKSSSISPILLENYIKDSKFYSMLMYGGDFYDYEKTLHYLVENYNVSNIVLHMSLHEISHYQRIPEEINNELHADVLGHNPFTFYTKYLTLNLAYGFKKLEGLARNAIDPYEYSQIIPETGVYNKVKRDEEVLGTLGEFITNYPTFLTTEFQYTADGIHPNIEALQRMKAYCDRNDVTFRFILGSSYYKEFDGVPLEDMKHFLEQVAMITDFWDFSGYNSISYEPRNFYDPSHYRNHVGELILAKMFNDPLIAVPKDFGHFVSKKNITEYLKQYPNFSKKPLVLANYEQEKRGFKAFMYHRIKPQLDKEDDETLVVTIDQFEDDLNFLKSNGYTTVSVTDIYKYMEGKIDLPQKSVVITFDDGYLDNYEYAYPLLKKYNMKAVFFPIGWAIGRDTFIQTDTKMIPHYDFNAIKEMASSGLIEFGSHTFDLHSPEGKAYGYQADCGYGIAKFTGEKDEDYRKRLFQDIQKSILVLEKYLQQKVTVFSYPYGQYSSIGIDVLKELDIKIAFLTAEQDKEAYKNPYTIPRINIDVNTRVSKILNQTG